MRHGCLCDVELNGVVVQDLDVEFADRRNFYAMVQSTGNAKVLAESWSEADTAGHHRATVAVGRGSLTVDHGWSITPSAIRRTAHVSCHGHFELQDFVLRYVFPPGTFQYGVIDGRRVEETRDDRYHQAAVDVVDLIGPTSVRLDCVLEAADPPVHPEMYIRSGVGGQWIVHARLMPNESSGIAWGRWRTRIGDVVNLAGSPLRTLQRFPGLWDRLFLRAERRGGPNLQVQLLAQVKGDQGFIFRSSLVAQGRRDES